MTLTVTEIYRHPVKAHGVEALPSVTVETGKCLPWDRKFAVAQEAAAVDFNAPEWVHCNNFTRGVKAPELMAIRARVDTARGEITLTHPRHGAITFDPMDPAQAQRFVDWTRPMIPASRVAPAALFHVPDRGLTDSRWPSVSINTHASLAALSKAAGKPLSPLRFRGNIWLAGATAWQEFDWLDRDIRIGSVVLRVRERIERCHATSTDPETGVRDCDMLKTLQTNWDHRDFGIKAEVIKGGTLTLNDQVELL